MSPERDDPRTNPLREELAPLREAGPCTVVIFGATGDLTRRKLLPALYNLAWEGLLHPDSSIVGVARRDWSDEVFRERMREGVSEFSRRKPIEAEVWSQLCSDTAYVQGEFQDESVYARLGETLKAIDRERGDPGCHLFYLATPPSAYETILANLGRANLVRRVDGPGSTRVVIEKPFGHDLESARMLNRSVHNAFHEDQVFRIDHYLGKETVQNLLVFRLDNGIFEPLWNRKHIDHVQITVAESVGVGTRAGYYEGVGVARDMLQNHLMQLLTLVAMEPPVRFDAKSVRDEKVKVLRAIPPFVAGQQMPPIVRGQYTAGVVGGEEVPGYHEEPGVAADSTTDTYLSVKLAVENWRWAGTPFYLRSGKRLPKRGTEITILFRTPPYDLFAGERATHPTPNVLRIRIQPEEGISLLFRAKTPGQSLHIEDVRMDMSYATSFGEESPEAYERLLLDAVVGDSTLFAREDEVELSWGLVDSMVGTWGATAPFPFAAGTWGPAEADRMLEADGRRWMRI